MEEPKQPEVADEEIDELLSWCPVREKVADDSLQDFGVSDECRRHIAGQVLQILNTNDGLKLSREHPSIFLVVQDHPSTPKIVNGVPYIEHQCKVLFFTNQGPKSFPYTLVIPVRNIGFSKKEIDQA